MSLVEASPSPDTREKCCSVPQASILEYTQQGKADSTADVKKEEQTKEVAMNGKVVQCGVLAKHIFKNNDKEKAHYINDPAKFVGTAETFLHRVSAMGAGTGGSDRGT
ncbi:hypothetical protein DFH07DRAFT_765962 [Mycena maculata]|uniref:Uncharacterized protein n=1 Tax=Mycena maculata TaxID=230809 RepID=A0AAD7K7M8_9AGAR|nr:hypothetical protein DFH07DRAFT_765962 [Mycena maculata]